MSSLFLLILAHFLADFPFQTSWLARQKLSRLSGVVIHGLVHFTTSALLLFPLWNNPKMWMGIGIIFVWHGLVDQNKIMLNRRARMNPALLFLLDQALHLGVITLVGFYLMPAVIEPYPIDYLILSYALILTLCTYTFDIVRWTLFHNAQPYQRDYKMMRRNALIVTVAFGLWFLL